MKKATVMLAAMMLVCGGWAVAQEPEKQGPPKKESPVPDEQPAPEENPAPEEQPEPADPDQTSENSELQLIARYPKRVEAAGVFRCGVWRVKL
uniref:hypothetical protein n=2 Tax=Alistipes megaguti TaxID=2364787 RepID=UPI0013CEB8A3|nr:hypothetical protein [Alistipes megaguti]